MKKIIFAISILFSTYSFAQQTSVLNVTNGNAPILAPVASPTTLGTIKVGTNLSITVDGTLNATAGGGTGTSKISVLNNVTDFTAFSDTISSVIVTDSIRGGIFSVYTGTDLIDDGMIFGDALSRKWRRITLGDEIFAKWYGAVPSTNTTIDNALTIGKAISYVRNHQNDFGTVTLEPCTGANAYYIASKIDLKGIKFHGSGGTVGNPSTLLKIAPNVSPFDIRTLYANVKDLAITHIGTGNVLDSGVITFKIRSVVRFENVYVRNNPNGIAFDISGCGPASTTAADSIFGNPDHAVFINVGAKNSLIGARLYGCDANAILFQNCAFDSNKIWNVYDNGFLGNTYINTTFNKGAQGTNNGAIVNGLHYYPQPDSVYNIVNKNPTTNPSYWYVGAKATNNAAWNSTTKYWGGGPIWAGNPNSNFAIISSSADSLQGSAIISARSAWYEGRLEAGIIGGIQQKTDSSKTRFIGAGIQSDIVTTSLFRIPSVVNGVKYFSDIKISPALMGSREYWLPNETGYLALSTIKVINRDPTITDITYNQQRVWNNTTTGTLRLYVNWGGALVVLAQAP